MLPMPSSPGSTPQRVTGRRNRLLALALHTRDHGLCGRCGLLIRLGLPWTSPYALTIGHIRPLALGGSNDVANLRPEHRRCNLSAGTRDTRPVATIVKP